MFKLEMKDSAAPLGTGTSERPRRSNGRGALKSQCSSFSVGGELGEIHPHLEMRPKGLLRQVQPERDAGLGTCRPILFVTQAC